MFTEKRRPIVPRPSLAGYAPIAFVLDALGTAANAAGTTSPSTVMNATILPSPTSLPGNVTSGSNTVLPYGNDAGVVGGSASQQTSNMSGGGINGKERAGYVKQQQTGATDAIPEHA